MTSPHNLFKRPKCGEEHAVTIILEEFLYFANQYYDQLLEIYDAIPNLGHGRSN